MHRQFGVLATKAVKGVRKIRRGVKKIIAVAPRTATRIVQEGTQIGNVQGVAGFSADSAGRAIIDRTGAAARYVGNQWSHDVVAIPGFFLQGTAFAASAIIIDRLINRQQQQEQTGEELPPVDLTPEELKTLKEEIEAELAKIPKKK